MANFLPVSGYPSRTDLLVKKCLNRYNAWKIRKDTSNSAFPNSVALGIFVKRSHAPPLWRNPRFFTSCNVSEKNCGQREQKKKNLKVKSCGIACRWKLARNEWAKSCLQHGCLLVFLSVWFIIYVMLAERKHRYVSKLMHLIFVQSYFVFSDIIGITKIGLLSWSPFYVKITGETYGKCNFVGFLIIALLNDRKDDVKI